MPNSRRAFPASGSLAHVEPMAGPLHQDWSNWGISYDTGPQDPNKSGFWPLKIQPLHHYFTSFSEMLPCPFRSFFWGSTAPCSSIKALTSKSAGYTELHHPQSPQWPEMDGGSRYFKGSPPGAITHCMGTRRWVPPVTFSGPPSGPPLPPKETPHRVQPASHCVRRWVDASSHPSPPLAIAPHVFCRVSLGYPPVSSNVASSKISN